MQLEIELKLTIRPEDASLFDQHPFILEYLQGQPQYYDLVSTYFDTPDHRLQKNGWSLRVRECGWTIYSNLKKCRRTN